MRLASSSYMSATAATRRITPTLLSRSSSSLLDLCYHNLSFLNCDVGEERRQRQLPNVRYQNSQQLPQHQFQRQILQVQQQQQRCFSSRPNHNNDNNNRNNNSNRRNNNRNQRSPNQNGPLANEKLIQVLMKRSPTSNPKEVSIRLVIDRDQDPDTPNDIQILSLPEAIQISIEEGLDLIAASMESDPPTIRCSSLSKLKHKQEQREKQKLAEQRSKKKNKQQKSFRFKAGIDDHDLARKVEDMNKFLQQGLECEYTIFTKAYLMRQNANAGNDLSQRILDLVASFGTLKRPPSISPNGNHIRCILEPKRQSKK